jgi:bifunctional lysine-specific demethylase and histidyl-hydroxylase NO66
VFNPSVASTLTALEDYLGVFTGSNSYLTPAGSQGFAPHWDDIDAFLLQLEGTKLWKVYAPRCDEETLPRFPSRNMSPEELPPPVLEVALKPGELLYMPRGWVHQAVASPEASSFHITISAAQRCTWIDYFEKLLPIALKEVAKRDFTMRRTVPRGYQVREGTDRR